MKNARNSKGNNLVFADRFSKPMVSLKSAWTTLKNFLTFERLFLPAVCLYICLQTLFALPLISKHAPPGGDDGYSYIYRAAQLRDCPFQDCKAVEDLREQFLLPTENLNSASIRNRQFTRIVLMAHPLHAAALLIIDNFTSSLEVAFDALYLVGKVATPAFVAFWIYALWGKRTATVALLLLAPVFFASHGLSMAVPSVLAIALACLLWGFILVRPAYIDFLLIPVSTALLLIHSMGILYVVIGIGLYLMLSPRQLTWAVIVNTSVVALLCAIVLFLPKVIERPQLEFSTLAFFPGRWNYLQELRGSLDVYLKIVRDSTTYFPHILILVILGWLGVEGIIAKRQTRVILSAISIGFLLVFGILYVVPWYGGFTFIRIWPLVAVFAFGLIAHGFDHLILTLEREWRVTPSTSRALRQKVRLLSTSLALAIAAMLVFSTTSNAYSMLAAQQSFARSRDFYLSSSQTELLKKTDGTVFYMDEVGMYFYLSHGALKNGAIYYPALLDSADLGTALGQAGPISYVVQRSLFFNAGMPVTTFMGIKLNEDAKLTLHSRAIPFSNNWELYIEELSRPAFLRIDVEGESELLELSSGPGRWVRLPSMPTNTMTIEINSEGAPTAIGGARPLNGISTQWLWDGGLSVEYVGEEGKYTVSLEGSSLADDLLGPLVVLNDYGYTILATTIIEP